jgi:hypothetical protein
MSRFDAPSSAGCTPCGPAQFPKPDSERLDENLREIFFSFMSRNASYVNDLRDDWQLGVDPREFKLAKLKDQTMQVCKTYVNELLCDGETIVRIPRVYLHEMLQDLSGEQLWRVEKRCAHIRNANLETGRLWHRRCRLDWHVDELPADFDCWKQLWAQRFREDERKRRMAKDIAERVRRQQLRQDEKKAVQIVSHGAATRASSVTTRTFHSDGGKHKRTVTSKRPNPANAKVSKAPSALRQAMKRHRRR